MKLSRLKHLEKDRCDRSNALVNVIETLTTAVLQCVTDRVKELDKILSDLEVTVEAQRVYDATAKLVVNLDQLPICTNNAEDAEKNKVTSKPRVTFPELSPNSPRRAVEFNNADSMTTFTPAERTSPDGGTSAGAQTNKSVCYTPFTPAPFNVDDEDDYETTVSPDKLSAQRTHGSSLPDKETHSEKSYITKEEINLADFMSFQPLEDRSTLTSAHGPAVVAMFESLRLLQTKLSAAVTFVDRSILPDLRSLRVRYFSCGEKGRNLLSRTMAEVQTMMEQCEKEFDLIAGNEELIELEPPFFKSVRQLQTAQAHLILELFDLVQHLNNTEIGTSQTFAKLGLRWSDTFKCHLDCLQVQMSRLQPAFIVNEVAANTMTSPSEFAFPVIPVDQDIETPVVQDDERNNAESPRWSVSPNQPQTESPSPWEEAPNAPLCGRSVRALHSTFKPAAVPFWFAGDADVREVSDARIGRILAAKGMQHQEIREAIDIAEWRRARQWLKAVSSKENRGEDVPLCGGALGEVFRLFAGGMCEKAAV